MNELYEKEIMHFFKSNMQSLYGIDCFALLVILPNNEMIHLSTEPQFTKIYERYNYGFIDQPTAKEIYTTFSFYPLQLPNMNPYQAIIHEIRENTFNINCGTNFVREVNTKSDRFYLIYCVASNNKNPYSYLEFASRANEIMAAGDFAYTSLLPIFQEQCLDYTLPKLEGEKILTSSEIDKATFNYLLSPSININELLKSETKSEFMHRIRMKIEMCNKLKLVSSNNSLRIFKPNSTITPKLRAIK